jgi:hypothetical protein
VELRIFEIFVDLVSKSIDLKLIKLIPNILKIYEMGSSYDIQGSDFFLTDQLDVIFTMQATSY